MELEAGDCRYPYGGDADGEAITFCGHPKREDSSYCTAHFHLTRGPGAMPVCTVSNAPLRIVEAA
jgi:GcrA cell cycle regulator